MAVAPGGLAFDLPPPNGVGAFEDTGGQEASRVAIEVAGAEAAGGTAPPKGLGASGDIGGYPEEAVVLVVSCEPTAFGRPALNGVGTFVDIGGKPEDAEAFVAFGAPALNGVGVFRGIGGYPKELASAVLFSEVGSDVNFDDPNENGLTPLEDVSISALSVAELGAPKLKPDAFVGVGSIEAEDGFVSTFGAPKEKPDVAFVAVEDDDVPNALVVPKVNPVDDPAV